MKMAADVLGQYGQVSALVHAAGTNIQRSWEALTVDDYRRGDRHQSHGAFLLREGVSADNADAREGTIVLIVSDAGINRQRESRAGVCGEQVSRTGVGAID